MSHSSQLVELADTLREKHLIELLANQRFRAQLDSGGKEAIWQQLDELTSRFPATSKEEKFYTLCPDNTHSVFQETTEGSDRRCTCCAISQDCGCGDSYGGVYNRCRGGSKKVRGSFQVGVGLEVRKAWIEKSAP
jgi:hypothetical protein